jgi:hypothetical protein
MSNTGGGQFVPTGFGDATLPPRCSMIWSEDTGDRKFFSGGSKENSSGQELRNHDRVHSVRVSRG